MSIESDISRICELLEVLTEVIVIEREPQSACGENCLCSNDGWDSTVADGLEDENSDHAATIEFIVQDDGDVISDVHLWLGKQINWSWQNRKNAEANAYERAFDYIQHLLKGKR